MPRRTTIYSWNNRPISDMHAQYYFFGTKSSQYNSEEIALPGISNKT